MPDLDKKINELIADIRNQSENENKNTEKEMALYKAVSIKEAESVYKAEAKKKVKRSVEAGSAAISSELAAKHMQAREELVRLRSKMTDEIIECAAKILAQFDELEREKDALAHTLTELEALDRENSIDGVLPSEEYSASLCKSAGKIASVLHSNRIVLYVKPDDLVYADMIKKAFGKYCTVEKDDSIVIGGIKGYDKILFKLADETLDGKLAVQRERFVHNSSLTISIR